MKKTIYQLLILMTVCLIVLNTMKLMQITIPCEVCGKPTFQENVLCRFASGWNVNFQHASCTPDYNHIFENEK